MNTNKNAPGANGLLDLKIKQEAVRLLLDMPFLSQLADWCVFTYEGKVLPPASVMPSSNGSFMLHLPGAQGEIFATLSMQANARQLEWSVEVSGSGTQAGLYFPFLARLSAGDNSRWIDFFAMAGRQGHSILNHRDADAPLLVTNGERSLVIFNLNGAEIHDYNPQRLIQSPGLEFSLSPEPRQVYRGKIVLVEGGWREAFAEIRAQLRSRLDLAEYRRDDLQWYSEQFVQHFTFLYGREILDLERGEFNVDRFLDEGDRDFGGYDGFLIWGVYPRIGIDERTQWDFYDDLPSGRLGLKQISERARQRGVRFFVPYKPWDRSASLHQRQTLPDEEELARLIVDSAADGVFLDTMDRINPTFRQAIDRLKPGVVFCSEGRAEGQAREIITGSWDQSSHRDWQQGNWSASHESMPVTDLWRFVLPEHRLFVINRHAVADDRMRITRRAFFNGMGWVVWQDIFGLTLPYAPAEAALLKKCRTIFRENLQAINSSAPTPLVETELAGVFANEFPAEGKRLWTFYNENDTPVSDAVLRFQPREGCHCVDIWNHKEAVVQDGQMLTLQIEPRQVGCVVEYPRLITVNGTAIEIRDEKRSAGAVWEIAIQKGESLVKYPVSPADARSALVSGRDPRRTVIKLLAGHEVLDQVCLEGNLP